MISVGIDIGTSTTQVIFSELTLTNTGGLFSVPRVEITRKQVIRRGEVHLTPLLDERTINAAALREIVAAEFRRAGIPLGGTDTGAVIITGESARKENAAAVLTQLSGFAGDFVVSTAGPDLESLLAGQGSGAQADAREHRRTTANFDVGGGTTNIAVFDGGVPVAFGCYDIGGRQLRFSPDGVLRYLSPSAQILTASLGLRLCTGEIPATEDLRRLAARMADLLAASISPDPDGRDAALLDRVRTAGSSSLRLSRLPEALCFSGGVADCIYHAGRDRFAFGDFGVLLGEAVRAGSLFGSGRVIQPRETIRATVIGAGMYTTTLSGSTIFYSDPALFPLQNLPVLRLTEAQERAAFAGEPAQLAQAVRWFLRQSDRETAVLALEGKPSPGYRELQVLAGTLTAALLEALPADQPLLALTRHDMGKALGQAMLLHTKKSGAARRAVAALDSVALDSVASGTAAGSAFLDFGRPQMRGLVVPVVVKTLLMG
ncbi:MAG: ethanolamine ammonia-lyase reactivating factor EutA [Oscillospiraceae bacterium]|jgi:ethanolamine utilization protein EutA|nr:ethanolamine ammonia-lyase reactivating factor EutA [Oscillospiraceae bacterium]